MVSTSTLQLHTLSYSRQIAASDVDIRSNLLFDYYGGWNKRNSNCRRIRGFKKYMVRVMTDSLGGGGEEDTKGNQDTQIVVAQNEKKELSKLQSLVGRLEDTIISLPPITVLMKRNPGGSFGIGLGIVTMFLLMLVKGYVARQKKNSQPGSVADLVRRGQLKSDRRGISSSLKYEDPFNNPMVKVSKGNSTVEMCGKVYKLAPVTLTQDQQAIHQKRRSRAYQWKRPTIFLKEGDPVPPDVDPDTIRWIPANHPFATTSSEIDEDLAQTNVYQKHGVPFRIQAEHEALQKRLESLQNDEKLGKLVIDPGTAREYERPYRSHSKVEDPHEETPTNGQAGLKPPRSDNDLNSLPKKPSSEETKKPEAKKP
ncbi:hypothetical protein LIER_03669 [Lithospermum erythrorhizon]|uniref:Protein MULTIPLE CHLOROPLAST DIVISION SITE 1 n=1 Tax=Lithospermum erythrorhizon TaxID=34254 RepID=A0AAV3NXZ1_LITER